MPKNLKYILILSASLSFAQEKIEDSIAAVAETTKDSIVQQAIDTKETAVIAANDSITKTKVTDSTIVLKKDLLKEEELATVNDTIPKDSLQIDFEKLKLKLRSITDNSYAKDIDSLWLKELYSNDLYDSIQEARLQVKHDTVYYPELSKDTLIARLKRLNDRTPFNVEYNPILESVIKRFLKNRQKSLQRLMALSEYYFPHFEKELDAYNMPLEMKYLAIVESALNPRAKSRVGATGLWQFMYPTGKMFGLDVSSYVDERSDMEKSTKAACEYLSRLYKTFGDWDLALASYNSGPGNVTKAIRRSGGKQNYWNIRPFLPRETAGYVPIFQATMYVFEYAKEHNFRPDVPEIKYFETDTLRVKKKIALDHVSELFDIKIEDLQFLNPAYKLDIIPVVKGEGYLLRLPKQYIGNFVTHEEEIYAYAEKDFNKREKPLPDLVKVSGRIRYRVRSGDYLGRIARKYGVKVSQIKRWNGLKSNNLSIGQRLTIYPKHPPKITSKKKSTAKKVTTKSVTAGNYKVKTGDTLYSIAKNYPGVSADNIKTHNGLKNNSLKPGMVLKIPKG